MNTTMRNTLPTLHVLYVTDSGIMDGKISMPVFIWGAYYFTGTSVTAKSFIAFIPGNNRSFVLFLSVSSDAENRRIVPEEEIKQSFSIVCKQGPLLKIIYYCDQLPL